VKKHQWIGIVGLAAFTIFAISAQPAIASELYAAAGPADTDIWKINQATGAGTPLGTSGFGFVGDLTSDTRVGSFTIWGTDLDSNRLVTINPLTGVGTAVGTYDSPNKIVSLAFDAVTGSLYGNTSLGFGAPGDTLYRVNPADATTTLIGRIGHDNVWALAFDTAGKLYGISDVDHSLLLIDTATGAGAVVATLQTNSLWDMAARPEDNVMFVAESGGSIWTVNTTTGAMAPVGLHGVGNSVGLAFSPIPEPATLALLAMGSLALMRHRRRA